jgi:hypothetical protein
MKGEGDRGEPGGLMRRNQHVDRLSNEEHQNRVGRTDEGGSRGVVDVALAAACESV